MRKGVVLSGDVLAMSGAERERLDVLRRVMRGELRQARAGELLGIGVRQVKRPVRGYRCDGAGSVVSRRRGRPSNNRLDALIARNAPSATGSSRKGVDNGLARYGAMGARFAKPLSTPTQTTHRCQKRDISTSPEKGTPLLCLDTRFWPAAHGCRNASVGGPPPSPASIGTSP